jgi:hypothetical protein
MRHTETSFRMLQARPLTRALWVAAVTLGIGLVMVSGPVRAGDDEEEDDRTFEEKIIDNVMAGVGATNMENKGIDYRERSPLVVPPKIDLPPPAGSRTEVKAPNWPKDPDEQRRKAAIAARKKDNKDPLAASRVLTPAELAIGKTAAPQRTSAEPLTPGVSNSPMLSPSQLGYNGGFSGLFAGNKAEKTEFKSEPTRDNLTMPPPGYQTPSSNFAYGTGPRESLYKEYNPAAGKYGE